MFLFELDVFGEGEIITVRPIALFKDPRIICHMCDLRDWDGTRKLVESLGPIHLLVNNAGVSKSAPFLEVQRVDIEKYMCLYIRFSQCLTNV